MEKHPDHCRMMNDAQYREDFKVKINADGKETYGPNLVAANINCVMHPRYGGLVVGQFTVYCDCDGAPIDSNGRLDSLVASWNLAAGAPLYSRSQRVGGPQVTSVI